MKWLLYFSVPVYLFFSALPCRAQQLPYLLWAKNMGSTNADGARSIFIDGEGNVYTTGGFIGTVDFDPGPGVFNLSAAGNNVNAYTQKLDSSGNLKWAESMGGRHSYGDYGATVAVDQSGNVYTAGYFHDTVDFDPSPDTFILISHRAGSANDNPDIFIQKLDSSSNFVWAKQIGGKTGTAACRNSIALDSSGNIFLAGYFYEIVDFDPGPDTFNLNWAGGQQFIAKLDSSGNLLWAENFGGRGWGSTPSSIAVNGRSGNIYIAGTFEGTGDFDPGPDTLIMTSPGSAYGYTDSYIMKLDSSGAMIWANKIGGSYNDVIQEMAIDASENIYITGGFQDVADFNPGPGAYFMTSAGGADIYAVKLDSSGNFIQSAATGGADFEGGRSIGIDDSGNVFLTGYFTGSVDFDPGPGVYTMTPAGTIDNFILKFDSSFNFAWAVRLGGPGSLTGVTIIKIAGPKSDLYLAGSFDDNAVDFDPGPGVFNLTSAGNDDIFVARWSQFPPSGVITPKRPEQSSVVCESSSRILRYTLPMQCRVSIDYYDIKGRLVASPVNTVQGPGNYSLVTPVSGMAKGAYVQVFKAGGFVKTERVMAVR
ncbi:MAG: hypothetical protein JW768_14485 [Chitinispirillaceae bacterium]|nr:hypothetical protein [Chitinispirillaceae bacterium]